MREKERWIQANTENDRKQKSERYRNRGEMREAHRRKEIVERGSENESKLWRTARERGRKIKVKEILKQG